MLRKITWLRSSLAGPSPVSRQKYKRRKVWLFSLACGVHGEMLYSKPKPETIWCPYCAEKIPHGKSAKKRGAV